MAQLVFEFWSQEIEPVIEAIMRVLDGCPTENSLAAVSLQYEPTEKGLNWAAQEILAGRVSSFALHPQNGGIRYAMLNGPGIGDDRLSGYMGTIESTQADYSPIWSQLLAVEGLRIVCLGNEEGVEFTGDQVAAETFPWDDGFLLIGAVRNHGGEWIVKRGPNYSSSVGG